MQIVTLVSGAGITVNLAESRCDVEQGPGDEIQIYGHRSDMSVGFRSGCDTSPRR